MEHQLYRAIVGLLASLGKPRFDPREHFTDHDIVKVYYWAVLHDRPTAWALDRRHWPPPLRRGLALPSDTTMSRRLAGPAVRGLLTTLEERAVRPTGSGLDGMIDGKPLAIGGCSKDRQAGYGRAAGGKAKGYKLHAIVDPGGAVAAWRLAPMNKDERVMAERLAKARPPIRGYLVAESNYDSNNLHDACVAWGEVLPVTRRRYGPGRGTGHRRQSPGRVRSVAPLEGPDPRFGEGPLGGRAAIERAFGNLTNWGGGLSGLPPWVRTHRRVHRWVQAKLVLTALRRQLPKRPYVA